MRYQWPKREEVDGALSSPQPIRLGEMDNWIRYSTTMFQWGGYCSPCAVDFQKPKADRADGLPCFEIWEFHDGEFPTDHCEGARHYCSADQLIRFGVEVIEMQIAEGHKPSERDMSDLQSLRDRISKVIEEDGSK